MDWASDTLEDEMQVALVDRLSQQVTQIDAALERLTRREYGICHDCDEFIGLARLKALPFAQRCTRCQTRAEQFKGVRERRRVAAILAIEDED
ncbi:MAG: TraR/DksA family transcriptional regulator [Candidatus Rokubacteria bacterium]|nr:TraR/DksA family transcriptional regulator [Candidatus Rokubacteria bacterium]